MLGNTPHPNHTAGTRIARLFSATRTAAVTFSFILAVSTPLALASLPHAASADPAPDDQAASQQDAAAQAESMLLELSGNLNEAGVTLSQIKAQEDATATQLAQTQSDLEAASAQVQTATEQLNRTAVTQYRTSTGGVSNLMGVLVSATSLDDLAAGMSYAQRITSQQQDALDGFVSARSELEAKKAALQTQQAALASLEVRFASQQTTVQTALTAQQEFYDNLSPEVKQAVAEREETQQALAQAQAVAAVTPNPAAGAVRDADGDGAADAAATAPATTATEPTGHDATDQEASSHDQTEPTVEEPEETGGSVGSGSYGSGTCASAVDAAESRLGCDYEYGASGHDTFDCSGLVMWAYARVGVDLPHNSSAQYYECSSHFYDMSQAKPGDLVFYGYGAGERHVALYEGGGVMIEAPHTGAVVRETAVRTYGGFDGFGRL